MCSKVSYIIPYRHSHERESNILNVLKWLKKIDGEVIIVEQDTEKKISFESSIKHVFTYSDLPFNKSWACNVGAAIAKYNKLAFADADIVLEHNDFLKAVKKLDTIDALSPYEKIIDLSESQTELYYKTGCFPSSDEEDLRAGINLSGGIILMNKDPFYQICGWCEDFIGWGGEDDFMTWKIKAWMSNEIIPNIAYHLWHPIKEMDEKVYDKNLDILRRCENESTEEVVNWIFESKGKIGNPNKYLK